MGDACTFNSTTAATCVNIAQLLEHDMKVKVEGVDCDRVLRGKVMAKDKFLSSIEEGFRFSSAVFGWDMHDVLYTTETKITSAENSYADFIATPDLRSFRRIPWESDIPFYPERDEALINAGAIALWKETSAFPGFGSVCSRSGRVVLRVSQEHGIVGRSQITGDNRTVEGTFTTGRKFLLYCQHACITAEAFQGYFVVDEQDIMRDCWLPWKGW